MVDEIYKIEEIDNVKMEWKGCFFDFVPLPKINSTDRTEEVSDESILKIRVCMEKTLVFLVINWIFLWR